MQLRFSQVTALCIILEVVGTSFSHNDEGLELLFSQRTPSDWETVWHQESHSRCREKLTRHLEWACKKDIYKLTRRNGLDPDDIKKRSQFSKIVPYPWLEKFTAKKLLRTRRSRARSSRVSITNECCTRVGCTWEEYAEYCPSNKRRNHYDI
ncbi:unnamed protein product [Hermetia illucens]|uniref:Insulin-like peptide 7 n=1 Tax=Hermetia illucens TaxID=343691 RepID=A0A7R8Z2L6_HERIL|nr:probable insulin-like peptide 7 [Hermetia illucens]XP_037920828.1 probable insulin-like peptide 7 [Hermetia illucens]CAD7090992.1 unnamed protein product [Hermetia illucens]